MKHVILTGVGVVMASFTIARAETLVYEGFGSADYTAGADIRLSTTVNDSVGLDTVNGWFANTGLFKTQSNGLSLPASWTASGSSVKETKAYRCDFGSTSEFTPGKAARRAQQRALTCTWPTSGSVYFRFRMHVPKALLSTSYLPNWGFILGGLGCHPITNAASDTATCTVTNGVYMGYRNRNATIETLAYVQPDGGALGSYPMFTIDATKDLDAVCVAKIDIGENGNDTLSLYVTTVENWNDDFEWTTTVQNISLISGANPLRYLQMIGQYKTNGNMASFDEFIVTTDPAEAYYHRSAAAPLIGDVSLVRTGANSYSVSATEASNDADLSLVVNDGTTATTNGTKHVEQGSSESWTVSGLDADKTYQVSVLASNGGGTDEKVAGTFYSGALTFGATTDANEDGMVAGGVEVSRLFASPWPLTVSYSISGSAGSEDVTWMPPVAVTIPANSASAVLPVRPRSDASVDEDVAITVALSQGNYELPAANAASLTLRNRRRFRPEGYAWKVAVRPSAATRATIGAGSYPDFPVLLRLPAAVSRRLCAAGGTDIYVVDENDAAVPFEVDTFDSAGESFVWAKVPSLSATTELTVFFGGAANEGNNPTNVWSSYVGVWHFAPSAVGSTNIVDATGHGFDGVTTNQVLAYEGPAGLGATKAVTGIKAHDYDSALSDVSKFCASGWFKAPNQVSSYLTFTSKKTGLEPWDIDVGWALQMPQSKTRLRFITTGRADKEIPDVTTNWNHFYLVSDGNSVKVYMNGSTTPDFNVSYKVKSSGTPYSMAFDNVCNREYRVRNGVADAVTGALEYKSVADLGFLDYGDVIKASSGLCIFVR